MPARNAARTIRAAASSVLSQLPDASELLILDDNSDDNTTEIVAGISDSRLRVEHSTSTLGVATALNTLLDSTRGKYLARMDADDLVIPGRFTRQLGALQAGLDVVFTSRINFGAWRALKPAPWRSISAGQMPYELLLGNPVPHSSMMARRDAFSPEYSYRTGPAEDWDLWMRMAAGGCRIGALWIPGILYRIHPSQLTRHQGWFDRVKSDPHLIEAHDSLARHLGWRGPSLWSELVVLRSESNQDWKRVKREIESGGMRNDYR